MRNVTITLDEETALWARMEAARRDTSVSRLVGELLRERMQVETTYEDAMRRFLDRRARRLKRSGARYASRGDVHAR